MGKIVKFFGGSALRQKRDMHPTDAIVGTGRVGRGLGKGGEVLLARATALFLVEDTRRHKDENFIMAAGGNGCVGQFLWVKPTLGGDFGDVVACTSHANMPLRRQSWE